MTNSSLGNKHFSLIGRLLALTQPEKARELLSHYDNPPGSTPALQQLPAFFNSFCKTQQLPPETLRGSTTREKADQRRLFISVMVRIYSPWIHHQHHKVIRVLPGFVNAISKELSWKKSMISNQIRQVIIEEKVYDDYRMKVETLTNLLIQTTTGNGKAKNRKN